MTHYNAMKTRDNAMKKRTHLKSACAATTLLISLVSAPPGLAATIRVPADYSTIQAAADAASSGDTVQIAPGVYAEQILIVGKSQPLPANLEPSSEPLWAWLKHSCRMMERIERHCSGLSRRKRWQLRGLRFEGEHLADAHSFSMVGIYFQGSSGRVENCRVEAFHGTNQLTSINGWGIKVVNYSAGPPLINVQVLNCTFADDKRAIGFTGDENDATALRTTFTLQDNTITGIGPTESGWQLGIGDRFRRRRGGPAQPHHGPLSHHVRTGKLAGRLCK